jgi:hypothetical protein
MFAFVHDCDRSEAMRYPAENRTQQRFPGARSVDMPENDVLLSFA